MKKLLFVSLFALTIITQAIAYDYQQKISQDEAQTNGWWPGLQIVFWPGMPPYTDKAVYGFRTGFPVSGGMGAVDGIEISPVLSYSDYIYGIQFSGFMNHTKIMEGMRLGVINTSTEWTKGWQIGMTNVNFRNSTGFDLGIVNAASKNMRGMQMGIGNYAVNQKGLQLGLVNIAERKGFQIGLINVIKDGWLGFCPIFNFSF